MLEDITNPPRDDQYYLDQWRAYYFERHRYLVRLAWFAAGTAIFCVVTALLPPLFQEQHHGITSALAVVGIGTMLATAVQWFALNWVIGGWSCPRCGERFFRSTFVNNPFGRYCRHCKLRRFTKSEVCTNPAAR
jgi:hypothetical protein